jgi:putative FmdB family regulatory protein
MPVYEYLCHTCDTRFEARRPMSEAASPIDCPHGHDDTTRRLSVFATSAHSPASMGDAAGAGSPRAGGCGPGCACVS